MLQNRNQACSCGSGKKYKNCCMKGSEKSFFIKNRVTIFLASFILFFGFLIFDGISNSEDTIYCYECKGYFPESQAAAHKTEPLE